MIDIHTIRKQIADRSISTVPPTNLLLVSAPTSQPERIRSIVIDKVWQQCLGDTPLCRWVAQRESHYFNGPGNRWLFQMLTYAACRDVLCFQRKQTEHQLVESL